MLERLAFSKSDTLYLLGDYIDRGPDSKGVIDSIWQLQSEGYPVHCLMGNHEEMTYRAYDQEMMFNRSGPVDSALLKSFAAASLREIPVSYIQWMRGLPRWAEAPGYVLVHAGLDFSVKDPLSNAAALIWIRNWYGNINREWLDGRLIVHGHTPVSVPAARHMMALHDTLPVQDIDCGAVYYDIKDYGQLCALDMVNRSLVFQPNVEAPF